MKLLNKVIWLIIACQIIAFTACKPVNKEAVFYTADNPNIQYTGRVDFSDPALPRFWAPGVYFQFCFEGKTCEITLNDELPWGNSHNYVSVVIDGQKAQRIRLTDTVNVLDLSKGLELGKHKVTVCKGTESGIGYLEFVGVRCEKLLTAEVRPERKIEFYGNSITCGTGVDTSLYACDSGEWHDKHNAYMSYGAQTARSLNAQWMLTSVSGIGLVHSCCELKILMPDVYDKMNLRANEGEWDFSNYQPDVLTVALGQNDGIQDSTLFCGSYVNFIHKLREKYPSTSIICLTSPMADEQLVKVLKRYITSVVDKINNEGDENVTSFFFSKSYNGGCDYHPSLEEHKLIATELSDYIKRLKKW